jgi:2-polyprenyl-3-methyl-5-hydroxy-6-metoxy-1,4-benzoquinol methylase
MKKIFDNYINNAFGGVYEQAIFKIQQFKINYEKFFPKVATGKVLDIGIGRGEMLTCMKDWGYDYHGIDISLSTVSYCQSLGLSCEKVDHTAEWLRLHKNTYDVITLLDVVEHIKKEEVIDFVSAIHGALKPGGVSIIQSPNMQSTDSNLHRYNDLTHELGLTEHSFGQLLMESGFKFYNIYGFEWFTGSRLKHKIGKLLRYVAYKYIHVRRRITGNLNPKILNPVFFAIAKKT